MRPAEKSRRQEAHARKLVMLGMCVCVNQRGEESPRVPVRVAHSSVCRRVSSPSHIGCGIPPRSMLRSPGSEFVAPMHARYTRTLDAHDRVRPPYIHKYESVN